MCQHTAPALTRGQQDRGSCLREAGGLPGEELPWTLRWPRMGVVCVAKTQELFPVHRSGLGGGWLSVWLRLEEKVWKLEGYKIIIITA